MTTRPTRRRFPQAAATAPLAAIGALFGEDGFGIFTRIATSMLEGALFASAIAGAIVLVARRRV